MATGVFLLALGILGFGVAALALFADPNRLDGRIFAVLAAIDSARSAILGGIVLDGHPLGSPPTILAHTLGVIVVGYASLEFAYSFPFERRAPRWLRGPAFLAMLGALALVIHPDTRMACHPWLSWLYFNPVFVLTLGLLYRNYRRLAGDRAGVALTMLAIVLRWLTGMFAYHVGFRLSPRFFHVTMFVEDTVAVAICYLLLVYSILRHQLFRVRSALAEVVVVTLIACVIVGTTWLAVEGILAVEAGPTATRTLLVLVGLVPLGLTGLALVLRPRLEHAFLCPIDPRRALRKEVLERVLGQRAVDPDALVEITRKGLEEVTLGGQIRLEKTVPGGLGEALHVRRGGAISAEAAAALDAVDADLIVPARPFGALVVKGGLLDRDSVLTAITLAQHLALRLENAALALELEESRRLAALGSFAAAIAHDIRTPLTSVQLNVQVLRGKSRLPPDDMEYFDIALDELKRLNEHVQELLDYAKPVKLSTAPLDLREVAEETARGMEPIFADRRLALERRHDVALPAVVGDPQRIRQVLWNLLDNAARASDAGGAIVLRTRAEDGRVAIEIEDAGRGIDAEHLPRIFDPFYTTRPDGTGLGLAICQKLVRAHHGEILVRSRPGRGSIFTVLLPAAPAVTERSLG